MKHPAKYTDRFIPIFAEKLIGCKRVYDPMAGTGKIAKIKDHGFKGEIFCGEIEDGWDKVIGVDHWNIGDSTATPFEDGYFDAICTSPTYGNRMADHFNAKDSSKRITYKHYLGRDLSLANTGRMQWGDKYRATHEGIYKECTRVLNGIFILNMSDHIRAGKLIPVTAWHVSTLESLGLKVLEKIDIPTPRMRQGANSSVRVSHEHIIILGKK